MHIDTKGDHPLIIFSILMSYGLATNFSSINSFSKSKMNNETVFKNNKINNESDYIQNQINNKNYNSQEIATL